MMGTGTSTDARIELARTLAHGVASGGETEANVEPVERIRYEELVRVAELHVGELTGLATSPSGAPLEVVATGPGSWAWHTVEDWKFLLEAMSDTSASGSGEPERKGGELPGEAGAQRSDENGDEHDGEGGPLDQPKFEDLLGGSGIPSDLLGGSGIGDPSDLLGGSGIGDPNDLLFRWITTMAPMLAAMQLGSAVGHLARTALGQYELPIPRPLTTRLLVVPATVVKFAEDWSLPEDEVRLWVCLRDVTSHAVLTRPHVSQRLRSLFSSVVSGMAEDAGGILDRLGGLDPADPESLQALMGDPESLLAQEPSPQRQWAADQLMALTSALAGYVEHVLDNAASRLLGGRGALTEAWRRRLVDREVSERAAEMMVGIDIGPATVDRGVAFVDGVVERAGEDGLARLWERESTLPTPAEIDAPGLWLERISL